MATLAHAIDTGCSETLISQDIKLPQMSTDILTTRWTFSLTDILIFLADGYTVGMHQTTWVKLLFKRWKAYSHYLKRRWRKHGILDLLPIASQGSAHHFSATFKSCWLTYFSLKENLGDSCFSMKYRSVIVSWTDVERVLSASWRKFRRQRCLGSAFRLRFAVWFYLCFSWGRCTFWW